MKRGFPCFSARIQRRPRLSEISLFFGQFRRLDSSVGGSVGWIRPLQALLANITPPITAISYYISITLGARSILYCAAGNTTEVTTVLVVWKLFFCPSQPSNPPTDRRFPKNLIHLASAAHIQHTLEDAHNQMRVLNIARKLKSQFRSL